MDIKTDIQVIYVGFTRRTVASIIENIIYFFLVLFMSLIVFMPSDSNEAYADFSKVQQLLEFSYVILMSIPIIVLEILMITRLGSTPGKLLCGIYIKDANTFKNVTLTQATIRCISQTVFSIVSSLLVNCVSRWFVILPILVLIFAIFDKRKQTFYDKIANTVVIGCKPS